MRRRTFVQGVAAAGAAAALHPGCRPASPGSSASRRLTRLDGGWRFALGDIPQAADPDFVDAAWQPATLPHSARIEALVTGPAGTDGAQWQGVCWYRREIAIDAGAGGGMTLLRFDGAMNVAEVWLDGEPLGTHLGGFLPFVFDLTGRVRPGLRHLLAVRLDNRDNPVTGPKPLAQLDFNMYHGLYRPVFLVEHDRLHITDPLLAGRPASGGVFVTFPTVSDERATVRVQTHVRNDHPVPRRFRVRCSLRAPDGTSLRETTSEELNLAPAAETTVVQQLDVPAPLLWEPAAPHLYTIESQVVADGTPVDAEAHRIGIRRLEISADGFRLNGRRLFLRGVNRHQEHPGIGNALADAAQYRDAQRIKEAGFDYVRLSHYPHSPAFMDACDELGLVVMNCIPGWQYFNPEPAFSELQYQNCRDLIRRDRNHACVALWEVSLNESAMPPDFVARTHAIAHEEYPGDQCYTAGWMPGYDVFIQARQHGGCRRERDRACLVSEYGDWEYYAMNAGLDQAAWSDLSPAESNSRQLRWQGERALLQQATNFQEGHNDNLATIAFGDGLWVMFDYNRGYAPDIESSGCMDLFRLPKFSTHFFRSQRPPAEGGPMVFIASWWTPSSAPEVRVFSNCEEVALYLDDQLLDRRGPTRDRMSDRLPHPPFHFRTGGFRAGTLRAIGYLHGEPVARHEVRTPGRIDRLAMALDLAGRAIDRQQGDQLFCRAFLQDARGTTVPDAWENVAFGASGGARLIGANPFGSDAGIASILVQAEPETGPFSVHAIALAPADGGVLILDGGIASDGPPPAAEVRYTTDGTIPGVTAQRYHGGVIPAGGLRAALLLGERVIATIAEGAPKFRISASAPPERREAFHR